MSYRRQPTSIQNSELEGGIDWFTIHLGAVSFGWFAFVLLAGIGICAYTAGRIRAIDYAEGPTGRLRAQPGTHGLFVLLCTLGPVGLGLLALSAADGPIVRAALTTELPDRLASLPVPDLSRYLDRVQRAAGHFDMPLSNIFDEAARQRWLALTGEVRLIGTGLILALGAAGFFFARRMQSPEAPIRTYLETAVKWLLQASAGVAVLVTIGIALSLAIEAIRFFGVVPPGDFLFGTEWNAQTNQDFGALPLFFGTFVVALIALAVAAPVGVMAAIYLSEYASSRMRRWAKPILEVLAGIPTVVYGFFAIIMVAPIVRLAARWINSLPFVPEGFLAAQPANALAAGLVVGVMIIPFVSSLSDDVIKAVPQSLRDGALALGATPSETIRQIVLPAAMPGILAAILLAVSRAIGETMIVVMAAGQRAHITPDVTSDITTVTAQIVSLLTGDSAFDSPKTLSAFALGGALFLVTLFFNLIALRVVRRYQAAHG